MSSASTILNTSVRPAQNHVASPLAEQPPSSTLLTEWSRLLFRAYVEAGVTDVVICPGARSLPFALAAINTRGLRSHSAVDERAAAFFALGMARWSGNPCIVLCTSGSAGTHFFPALAEASADYVPLIVITADRPPELHDCGASQTMDQVKLFGAAVRHYYEVGTPHASEHALRSLRRVAAQSAFASQHPVPGPVHLNVRARKPLEPCTAVSAQDLALVQTAARVAARVPMRVARPHVLASKAALAEVARLIAREPHGLIVCGPLPAWSTLAAPVRALASCSGYPVLAEATSQLRFSSENGLGPVMCDGFDRVLRSEGFVAAHRPRLILQLGTAPTSSAWEKFALANEAATFVTFAEHGYRDPLALTEHMILGEVAHSLRCLVDHIGEQPDDSVAIKHARRTWAAGYRRARELTWQAVDEDLRVQTDLTEGAVARATVSSLPQGSALFLGNSLPIRLAEGFCPASPSDVRVLSQRGLSGIDGAVAAGWGSAWAAQRPTTLLIGDLTFLHDLSALALSSTPLPEPVVIVVIQNSGGRIFEQLPIQGVVREHEKSYVFTPHAHSFEHAARMFGARYACVSSVQSLEQALEAAHATRALTIIEAVVSAHAAAEDDRRINERVARALEAEWPR